MASYRVFWILSVTALVGCALESTVASEPDEIKQLKLALRAPSLTSEEVEKKLKEFKHKDMRIDDMYSVDNLIDLCRPTLGRCFHGEFDRPFYGMSIYEESIPQLFAYGKYCRDVRLKEFCVDKIDTLAKVVLDSDSKEDQELVLPFWTLLRDNKVLEHAQQVASTKGTLEYKVDRREIYAEIQMAYLEHLHSKYGNRLSINEEEEFLHNITRALKYYSDTYNFFLRISDYDERGPVPMSDKTSDLFEFGRVASDFVSLISMQIFDELQARASNGSGGTSKRNAAEFMRQINAEFSKSEKHRVAAGKSQQLQDEWWFKRMLHRK